MTPDDLEQVFRTIGGNIRTGREAMEITQLMLSHRCRLGERTVGLIEGGRPMTVSTIYCIAEVLRCNVHDLLPATKGRR